MTVCYLFLIVFVVLCCASILPLSLSLSRTHTLTHTHTRSLSLFSSLFHISSILPFLYYFTNPPHPFSHPMFVTLQTTVLLDTTTAVPSPCTVVSQARSCKQRSLSVLFTIKDSGEPTLTYASLPSTLCLYPPPLPPLASPPLCHTLFLACSLSYCSLNLSLTHSLTHLPSLSLAHSLTRPHSLSHTRTRTYSYLRPSDTWLVINPRLEVPDPLWPLRDSR